MSVQEADDERKHLGAEVSKDLKRRVRVAAAEHDMSMSEFIRHVLDDATE